MDAKPTAAAAKVEKSEKPEIKPDTAAAPKAAWHDEDDEDLEVNIQDRAALKKLRTREDEAVVTGTEYQDRLRQQYAVHPTFNN